MEVVEMLDNLKEKARRDPALREMLLATRREKAPLAAFCKKCRELGVPVYEMDLIAAGEDLCSDEEEYQWRRREFSDA